MKMMQSEMETVFEMKVNEKKQKLKDMEADVSTADLLRMALRIRCFCHPVHLGNAKAEARNCKNNGERWMKACHGAGSLHALFLI